MLLAAALAVALVQVLGRPLVRPLMPIFGAAVPLLDPRFEITSVRLARIGASEVVRFRGNLSRPLVIRGRVLEPFGWNGMPAGGIQCTYTVGGVLQYDALLLILVLAWPASRLTELACRLGLALPCVLFLPVAIVPFTAVAEFRQGLASMVGPGAPGGWLIASRYLMGGGGWVIALLTAVACLEGARRLTRGRRQPAGRADHPPICAEL